LVRLIFNDPLSINSNIIFVCLDAEKKHWLAEVFCSTFASLMATQRIDA